MRQAGGDASLLICLYIHVFNKQRSVIPRMNTHNHTVQLDTQPAEVRHLLETTVTSFVRWDILAALNEEGPHSLMALDSLAQFVGREPAQLIPELGALVSLGVLEREQDDSQTSYRLRDDQWQTVEQFVSMCEDPDFRLLVIGWIWDTMKTEEPAQKTSTEDREGST